MANTTNWLNISSQSGSSGQTILTLSAQRNLATNYKTATIRAYNPVYNVTAETYVTIEAYSPYIEVAPTIVGVPESGGTYQLSISANCSYVIAYPDLVSSYSTTAATGDTTITFSVSGTYESSTLIGNIVITDESGQVSKTVRVEQYGAGAQISLWPATIYIPATGGTGYFNVSANCPYTVTKANGEAWFNVNPESGYTGVTNFTVTAGENTGSTDISGYISINGPGNAGGVIRVVHKAPTRLVVGYYVTSTTQATRILYTNWGQLGKAELGDGTEITLGSGYTFPATGMQYVYYTLTGTNIPSTLFSGCTSVRSASIPNSVTQIDYGAFGGCTGLESISIPDSVTSLASTCFRNDTSLSSVTFGSGLTQIGSNCFNGCTNLTTVSIPSGVTSIGQLAFSTSSDGPSTFYFYSQTPPTLGLDALTSADLAEIIVPCPYVQAYLSAWSEYAEYISCQDDTQLYFVTDTSNVKGIGETRTITVLNTNINSNDLGLNFPAGSYTVSGNVIYVTYPKNPSSSSTRTWTIGVVGMTTGGTSLSGSYTITQNANVSYSIPYTADTSTVNKSGETRTITIDTSNLVASSITIGSQGASGITYTYSNGVITVVFPPNSEADKSITVTVAAETLLGDEAYMSVTFYQDGETIIPTGDTRVVAVYDVQTTASSITVLGNTSYFNKAECPDGTQITLSTTHKFSKMGTNIVYYTLKNSESLPGQINNTGTFEGVTALTNCLIPDSVTTMGNRLFQNCTNLSSITLSSALTSMGADVFYNCRSLSSVTLPQSLTGLDMTFRSASSLTSITIPDSVTYIGDMCFSYCESLQSAVIGSGMSMLGQASVQTGYYTAETIGERGINIFSGCTSLSSVTLPNNVTLIGDYCFKSCSSLRSISLPDTIQYIGVEAFKGCTSLSSVTFPSSTTFLGDGCFENCYSLQNVTMNNALKYLGHSLGVITFSGATGGRCFSNCTGLTTLDFPASLQGLGYSVLNNCSSLTSIAFESWGPPGIDTGSSLGSPSYSYPIYVPCNSVTSYQNAFGSNYSQRIQCASGARITGITLNVPSSITGNSVASVSYQPHTAATSISYSSSNSSVATIDQYGNITAISNGQTTICVEDSLTGLRDCSTINVEMPLIVEIAYNVTSTTSPVTIIRSNSTGEILSAELGDGTQIQVSSEPNTPTEYTFSATGIQSVFYKLRGNKLAGMIGVTATSAIIPSGVTGLGSYVFNLCQELTSVTIPNTVTDLGFASFASCGIYEINIPNGVTGLSNTQFGWCSNLSSVTIPDSVTIIGYGCFEHCSSLTEITIPSGVTSIEDYCFYGCGNLSAITSYAVTAPPVGQNTFKGAKSNGILYYPSGSNYSAWMSSSQWYLGYNDWTSQPITP